MKAVILHLGFLAVLYWGICGMETHSTGRPHAVVADPTSDSWRRTADGWEQQSEWRVRPGPPPTFQRFNITAVHPLNIAMLQALISIGALILLPSSLAEPAPRDTLDNE